MKTNKNKRRIFFPLLLGLLLGSGVCSQTNCYQSVSYSGSDTITIRITLIINGNQVKAMVKRNTVSGSKKTENKYSKNGTLNAGQITFTMPPMSEAKKARLEQTGMKYKAVENWELQNNGNQLVTEEEGTLDKLNCE